MRVRGNMIFVERLINLHKIKRWGRILPAEALNLAPDFSSNAARHTQNRVHYTRVDTDLKYISRPP